MSEQPVDLPVNGDRLPTNGDRLITISVLGEIASPRWGDEYRVGFDGVPRVLPGPGGIVYDARVGDPAFGWVADHVEPGVSIKNPDQRANNALNMFACIGNEAVVVSGAARDARGVVTGLHGGIEHVLIDFPPDVLDKLIIGDRIQVRARGRGLALTGWPGIRILNTSPRLLAAMGLRPMGDVPVSADDTAPATFDESPVGSFAAAALQVPVTAIIPAVLMGAGIGAPSAERGDYDLAVQDRDAIVEHGLDQLRLGDIVAIADRSAAFGRAYLRGALEVGVVVHSDSYQAGHGPGIVSLMSARHGELRPFIDPTANIAHYLNLRSDL